MRACFENLELEVFGESHSEEVGVRLGGIPDGSFLTLGEMRRLLLLRGSKFAFSTPRHERDLPQFSHGLKPVDGGYIVDGTIEACVRNENVRKGDYDVSVLRPSHADYPAYMKDGKLSTGGGRFSGRMTLPICIAGGIAEELLQRRGIEVVAYLSSVGQLRLKSYMDCAPAEADIECLRKMDIPMLDESKREETLGYLADVAADGDSVGGVVECAVFGLKAGQLGDALFDGLEGKLAYSIFAIPAVKGVEFGHGSALSGMRGSTANDAIVLKDGKIAVETNRAGGINGGISNGNPVLVRAAIRPTPTIFKPQRTVDVASMREVEATMRGRHDACVAVRAVAPIEAAVALAILDEVYKNDSK